MQKIRFLNDVQFGDDGLTEFKAGDVAWTSEASEHPPGGTSMRLNIDGHAYIVLKRDFEVLDGDDQTEVTVPIKPENLVVEVKTFDARGVLNDNVVLPVEEAADFVRRFVFIHASDPDGQTGGVGKWDPMSGSVKFSAARPATAADKKRMEANRR